jgi:hypothetical protein
VYEAEGKPGTVLEVQAHFRVREPDELTPKAAFRGKILAGELEITSSTKPSQLEEIKGWKKTDCYIEHCYRYSSKGVYIFFQYNEAENELTDISVGPDKR